jgi:hypothetical protein
MERISCDGWPYPQEQYTQNESDAHSRQRHCDLLRTRIVFVFMLQIVFMEVKFEV